MDISLLILASAALFAIGLIGVLLKRNPLIFFICVEMMLNASNLLFVTFARQWGDVTGQVWVFFILVVAAAEAAVGLALIINLFRSKQVMDMDQYDSLRG